MGYRVYLSIDEEYKAGDKPPKGYREWHAWAEAQIKGGIKQTRCKCKKYLFPQEVADHICEVKS